MSVPNSDVNNVLVEDSRSGSLKERKKGKSYAKKGLTQPRRIGFKLSATRRSTYDRRLLTFSKVKPVFIRSYSPLNRAGSETLILRRFMTENKV